MDSYNLFYYPVVKIFSEMKSLYNEKVTYGEGGVPVLCCVELKTEISLSDTMSANTN